MHTYATDASDRDSVPVVLAVFAVTATLALNGILTALRITLPWFVDAPSVMGFYSILHSLYDRYLWHAVFGTFRLSDIPDLRGTWVGEIHSSHVSGMTSIQAVLQIQQTWSRVLVRQSTATSASVSEMGAVNTANSSSDGLHFEYRNEPKRFTVGSMHIHRGTARLHIAPDQLSLTGDYYNDGRDRQTYGEMRFQRVSREILTYEDTVVRLPQPAKVEQ